MGIANKLTLFRLALSPVFLLFFMLGGMAGHILALLVSCLMEATDLLDGYLARTKKETTDFGKLFDPMADSIARFSIFLCLLWGGYADLWVVALVFYRDFMVAYIRVAAARAGVVLAARVSGKMKAITQGIVILAILILIVLTPHGDSDAVQATMLTTRRLMLLVAAVTLWSGFDYVRMSLPLLHGLLRREP